jgi:hypothetical protein
MTLLEARGSNQYVTCPLIHTETVNVEQPLPNLKLQCISLKRLKSETGFISMEQQLENGGVATIVW